MDYPGAWYHVMNRGIERRRVFDDDDDRRSFLRLLASLEEQFGVEVHAYCLMDNHYHLALHTPEANLSRAMRWLGQSYTQGFNRRHDRVGPLFQGRFKSIPVDPENWLIELSVYIYLNPLRIARLGLGKLEDARESRGEGDRPSVADVDLRLRELRGYQWSSYRAYGGYRKAPEWLKSGRILGSFGKYQQEQRSGYRKLVRERLKRGTDESAVEKAREEIALGNAAFVDGLRRRFGKSMRREDVGKRKLAQRLRLETILSSVEEVKEERKEYWLKCHGDDGKWLVLLLARHRTGQTLRELGEALGGLDYSAVSVGIRRYEKKLKDQPNARRTYNRVAKMLNVDSAAKP